MAETFSQQFCSLARCGAGGRIVAGRRARNCLVQVADGKLVIVMAPSVLLARVPVPMVEITALLTAGAVSHAGASGHPLNSQAIHDQPLAG